jgi:hypothetical protein
VFTCLVSNVNGTTLSSNAVLTMLAPPVNDNCTGAIVVTGLSFTNTQSTIHASSNGDPAPACVSNFGMGVWFAFTAPDNGTVVADTIGSDFDTGLGAYTGSCAALTQVGCDDESGGNQTSKLTHAVTVGVIYYYLAGGYGGASGNLIFHLIYSGIAPTISTQPANQTVSVNGTANFSVAAGGAAPLSYFWRRNGVPIAGASNSFYTTNNVQLTDSGARFSCLVSNAYGTLLSSNALLTVSGPTSSNLVQNWGFETGDFAFWGTTDSLSGFSVVDTAPYPHSGSYGAEAGPIGALGFIGQTLATTPGQTYIFGCYLYGDGNTPNEFVMSWDGLTVLDLVNYTNAGWTNINLLVHATNSMTVMQFGFQNDPSYFGFDDVSVILPVAPTIQSATRTNGNLLIAWSSIPGLVYRVQYKTNLVQTNWIDLGSTITAAGTTSTLSDPIGPDPRRFYHVVLLP